MHFQSNFGDAIGKKNVCAVGLVGLRGPVVGDRRAVRLQGETACNFGFAFFSFEGGGAVRGPAGAGRRNLKVLMPDGFAVEQYGKLSLVRLKDGGSFFLRVAERDTQEHEE